MDNPKSPEVRAVVQRAYTLCFLAITYMCISVYVDSVYLFVGGSMLLGVAGGAWVAFPLMAIDRAVTDLRNSRVLFCPCCRRPLVKGPPRKYTELHEHASDPNMEPPPRAAYVCDNPKCTLFSGGLPAAETYNNEPTRLFWSPDGSVFHNVAYGKTDALKKHCVGKNLNALNSFSRSAPPEYSLRVHRILRVGHLEALLIGVHQYTDDGYAWRKGWDLRFTWKHIYMTNHPHMVLYCWKSFRREYRQYLKNSSEDTAKELLRDLEGTIGYTRKGKELWRRFASWSLRVTHPKLTKELRERCKEVPRC